MNYIKIDNCNMNNGDGLRCVVWLSGCNHHCPGCFNPETWDFSNGDEFTEYQYDNVLKWVANDWCSGLTLTGGDPVCQDESGLKQLIELVKAVNSMGKTTWLWTGFKWEDLINQPVSFKGSLIYTLLTSCDVVVDGAYIQAQKDLTLKWRGSFNQRVIDVEKTLLYNKDKIALYEE